MNDMEAAREAALADNGTNKVIPTMSDRMIFRRGFERGWNARQPKPCVWTLYSIVGIDHTWQTGCNGLFVVTKGFSHCPYCGGKIEEANDD